MKRKEYKKLAYEFGIQGFKDGLKSAPCLNVEFMKMVPNCAIEDNKGVGLRIAMYKEYSRGFIETLLKD
jgi:hypothetical protein